MNKSLREMTPSEFNKWIDSFHGKDSYEIANVIYNLLLEKDLISIAIQELDKIMMENYQNIVKRF